MNRHFSIPITVALATTGALALPTIYSPVMAQATTVEAPVGDNAVVAFAKAQLGKPYKWGAEGPYSYDCSGLTMQAWKRAGISIPRTSQEQWRKLPHVSLSSLIPGDLVVYYSNASHVGIYIGGGKVLYASHPGSDVHISNLHSMPVLGAVRPGYAGSTGNTTSIPVVTSGKYTVKSGDTLSGIAAKHGTTWQKIWQKNKALIPNPHWIYPGQKLSL